ncbi:DUF6214 family protein [Streptomyces sp. NPDC059037]|uniref:DUF6214 family protein n=1 Tax=Streptomyces sp. NPDC059037 TaxID=3346710 RepID=UPI0036C27DAF
MSESSFVDVSDHCRLNEAGGADDGPLPLPPWFHVRLTFADGAVVDARAVVSEGRITLGDLSAGPPAPAEGRAGPAVTGHWSETGHWSDNAPSADPAACAGAPARHRARPSWPRGREGRRLVAEAYRAAQGEGRDPVLAVMSETGRSRRRSLKLVAAARDAGFLPPRHNRP